MDIEANERNKKTEKKKKIANVIISTTFGKKKKPATNQAQVRTTYISQVGLPSKKWNIF